MKITVSLNAKKNIFCARAVKTAPQVPLTIFLTLHTNALMAMLGICPDLTARHCKQLRTRCLTQVSFADQHFFLNPFPPRLPSLLQEHHVYSLKAALCVRRPGLREPAALMAADGGGPEALWPPSPSCPEPRTRAEQMPQLRPQRMKGLRMQD